MKGEKTVNVVNKGKGIAPFEWTGSSQKWREVEDTAST